MRVEELFKSAAASYPKSIALVFDNQEITYGELCERAVQLAQKLIARGVGPGCVTGVYMTRSVEMIVSLLAIMDAGGTYLPLDPSYPLDRLLYMVHDADASLIVTTADLARRLPYGLAKHYLIDGSESVPADSQCRIGRSASNASIDDLAYVIYTSGTTGRPKGILTTHRNVTSFLWAMKDAADVTTADIFLAIASISFDPHVVEILLPLVVGAKTVLVRETDTASPDQLTFLVAKHGITIMQATPATWQLLLSKDWKPDRTLRALCGGESMMPSLKNALLSVPGITLSNVYGPTETTVWCSVKEMTREADVCIGPPLANARFYVLDEDLTEVAIGDIGELHIGGEGLAIGYLNQPQLTSEKFIPNPFSLNPSGRLYRSGDIVRKLNDGCVQYLNRSDYQVKLRGFRIELLEVEAAITRCPQVSEAAVIADGTERLIAFVVAVDASAQRHDLPKQLRDALATTLPFYMIPSAFYVIDRIPLTSNRKIDRQSLLNAIPEIPPEACPASIGDPVGRKLYQIWSQLLQQRDISPTDHYADIGGNSINLITLRLRIMEVFKVDIPIKNLIMADTIESMGCLMQNTLPTPVATRWLQDRISRLSPSQELLLLELPPNRVALNNLEVLLLTKCALSTVSRAILTLLRRHDVFSINWIGLENNHLHQHFTSLPVAEIIDATARHKTATDFINQIGQYRSQVSLATGNLYAWVIFNAGDEIYIYFIGNHLIVDDMSINILTQELDMLLRDLETDLPAAVSFREWLQYYYAALNEGWYDDEHEYWRCMGRAIIRIEQIQRSGGDSSSIRVLKKTFCRSKLGFFAKRTQQVHNVFLTCCIFTIATLLSIKTVACRLVASGRNIFDDINDSFTVGWLAYSYPMSVPIQATLEDTYRELGRYLEGVPHRGSGFGWLRCTSGGDSLLDLHLNEIPMYFNFLPRQHLSATAFSDISSLLPPAEESRLTMVGIGFLVQEFEESFSIAAAYDSAITTEQMVAEAFTQLEANVKMLCKLDGEISSQRRPLSM